LKAAILKDKQCFEIIDIPIPEIGDEEVLFRVSICGLCASESFYWKNGSGALESFLGHEPIGIVEAVGKRVTALREGDRVTGTVTGCFAEYAKAHFMDLVKVPDSLCDTEAMGEPLSCLISGALNTPVDLGDTVAVIGVGYFGLGFLQLMAIKGAAHLIAIDIREEALKTAKLFGASEIYHPDEVPRNYLNVLEDFSRSLDIGVDVSVEATGTQEGLNLSVDMARQHGILTIPGYHQGGDRSINMQLLNLKAVQMINAHEAIEHERIMPMKRGFKLLESKKLDMKSLVTHEYGLAEINHAFNDMEIKPSGYIKGYIKMM